MLKLPDIFEHLLQRFDIREAEREVFLNPEYRHLHDPMLLPDAEKARDRIIRAMKNNEHIVVFSDYDADGIPGAVVISDFFNRAKYSNVSFYIPHRHDEGFGLNKDAVIECANRGAKLIITIDCGTADKAEILQANTFGVDVIVTDHHEETHGLPPAYAVVNPKRKDSTYPFKDLCGSAVIYKLIQAVLSRENFGIKEGMEKWSLDMVGIATLSDMVPLRGENRILAKYGLEVLRKTPRPGIASLLKKLNINQKNINEDDVGFMITPRINAASRMGKPEDAFKLLSTQDMKEAEVLAAHLEKINNERKGVVASVVKEAKKHLEMRQEVNKVIVIGNPEWRPALLGLVANSLVEEYDRPVFVWGRDGDGMIKGSCRSNGTVDLCVLMSRANAFLDYGGHSQAGGFSLSLESLVNLEDELSRLLDTSVKIARQSEDDIAISLDHIGEELWQTVSMFAPFGVGNEKPLFKLQGEIKSARSFGKEGNHLELTFQNSKGREIKAISFFTFPETYKLTNLPMNATVLAHLEKSYFRNRPELRLRIIDIL